MKLPRIKLSWRNGRPFQGLPERAVIKKWAHAFTVAAVAWIGVSVAAVVAYSMGKADGDDTWVAAAFWAWRFHGIITGIAVLCWVVERPTEVRYLKENFDDESA